MNGVHDYYAEVMGHCGTNKVGEVAESIVANINEIVQIVAEVLKTIQEGEHRP